MTAQEAGALAAVLCAVAVLLSSGGRARAAGRLSAAARPRSSSPTAGTAAGGGGGTGDATAAAPLPWPLVLDLLAAVLTSGAAASTALRAVGTCLNRAGDPSGGTLIEAARALDLGRPAPAGQAVGELVATLELSNRTGMAPVPLVTAAAAARRRRAREAQAVAAQRLGVLVVLPTGLCLLPAFVLLTVAPLVLDLLS